MTSTVDNEAREIDMDAAKERLARITGLNASLPSAADQIAHAGEQQAAQETAAPAQPATAPKRAKRSDAGVPRPKKPEPVAYLPGTLTAEQWSAIHVLAGAREDAALAQMKAAERYNRASADFSDYIDSLKKQ